MTEWFVLQAICCWGLTFLILYDIPVVPQRAHRLVLLAWSFWTFASGIVAFFLATNQSAWHEVARDRGLTIAVFVVAVTHLYWMNRRGRDCERRR